MNVHLITVGLLKQSPENELIADYQKRLSSLRLKITQIDARKYTTKIQQSEQIKRHIQPQSFLIALDERGEDLSTQSLCDLLQRHASYTILIGGADGLDETLIRQANQHLRLGKMTWPHMLARVLIVEQLYRCQQIYQGHPYHRV